MPTQPATSLCSRTESGHARSSVAISGPVSPPAVVATPLAWRLPAWARSRLRHGSHCQKLKRCRSLAFALVEEGVVVVC